MIKNVNGIMDGTMPMHRDGAWPCLGPPPKPAPLFPIFLRGLGKELSPIGYSPGEVQENSDPVSRQYAVRRKSKNKAARKARRRNSRSF